MTCRLVLVTSLSRGGGGANREIQCMKETAGVETMEAHDQIPWLEQRNVIKIANWRVLNRCFKLDAGHQPFTSAASSQRDCPQTSYEDHTRVAEDHGREGDKRTVTVNCLQVEGMHDCTVLYKNKLHAAKLILYFALTKEIQELVGVSYCMLSSGRLLCRSLNRDMGV